MPDGTQQAWPRMTANYRTNHAGGWSGYTSFWRPIESVSVRNVVGRPPGRARATIIYFYRSGRVDTEVTDFGLVEEGGQLKISSSNVISSVSRNP
jgi:hypothetical protein